MSTILHRLDSWADTQPNSVAQRFKKDGKWVPISAEEYANRVYWLALFLDSKGMTQEDIGTILAYNSPQWVHMDLAALLLGAKSAGLYPNSAPKDLHYVLNHTESRFLAVGGKDYFNKVIAENRAVPERIKLILSFDDDISFSPLAVGYTDAIETGKKIAQKKETLSRKEYLARLNPTAGAFMIYTSGTTGNPKGALISHENLVFTIDNAAHYWGLKLGEASLFSFLPLCHIAEKVQNVGAGILLRFPVSFCTAFDNISKELPEVQPGLLLCVPRLWEKMMEGVLKKVDASPPNKKRLVNWAFGVGERIADAKYSNKSAGFLDQILYKIADLLVLSKIREALGLAQAKVLVSGAAPLPSHVCKWFRKLGLEISEVFGQTESTGIICLTLKGVDCAGTVGKAVPGIEVKIAEDGEIVTRGKHVFVGYFKDATGTSQVLEGDSHLNFDEKWLHTGDLAEYDSNKMIRIRGRKKEIMKTSGGKMVAPAPIEDALKAAPIISQVCMVGDGKKYLSALITLSEGKMEEIKNLNKNHEGLTLTYPELIHEVGNYVETLNSQLASFERIKKFAILSREFSVADGEMTPTLKMKRSVIETRFKDVIEGMY